MQCTPKPKLTATGKVGFLAFELFDFRAMWRLLNFARVPTRNLVYMPLPEREWDWSSGVQRCCSCCEESVLLHLKRGKRMLTVTWVMFSPPTSQHYSLSVQSSQNMLTVCAEMIQSQGGKNAISPPTTTIYEQFYQWLLAINIFLFLLCH